jgi:F0F1-type ATP synthase epsilon subunit
MLNAGATRIHVRRGRDEDTHEFATGPGFFKVEADRALALVDDAVNAKEIDEERARKQLEESQAELEKIERGESDADRWQIEQRIKHAENQLAVIGRV